MRSIVSPRIIRAPKDTGSLRKHVRHRAPVPYNIAEGHKRGSTAEYIRFLGIAAGSASELETQLLLAARLGYFKVGTAEGVLALHAEVERMLAALMRTLKAKISSKS